MSADGLELPGFEQVEQIGKGGFGVVYRAFQPAFRRTVAIKVLTEAGTGEAALAALQREAEAMGSLSGHPNIVTVHEAGLTDDGQPFLVMPYLPGGTLAQRLEAGPLPAGEATSIVVRVAGALATAHAEGVLHRDVKPDNVLFSAFGEPLLADFGIARVGWTTSTITDGVQATVLYAPPEILSGGRPSPASDVYSLAATLYAALDGGPAFVSEDDVSLAPLIARIATTPPPPLDHRDVSPDLWAVVERAMAKVPEDRQPSMARFGRDLQRAQRRSGQEVTSITLPPGAGVEDDRETEVYDEPHLVARRRTVSVGTDTSPSNTTRIVLAPPTPPGDGVRAARSPRRSRRTAVLVAALLVLVVVVGVGALLATGGGDGATEDDGAPRVVASDVAPADRAEPAAGSLPRPTFRAAEPVEPGVARLSWDDVEGPVAGYAIQQGDEVIDVVGTSETAVTVTGLEPSRRTCFLVGAVTAAGEASWTAAQRCVSTVPPAAPTILRAEDEGGGVLLVEWADGGRNTQEFTLSVDGQPRMTADVGVGSVRLDGLPDGRDACVVITATNEAGSAASEEVCEPIS